MTEDETTKIRASQSRFGKAALMPDQAVELRELYGELQEVAAAGAHALGAAGTVPAGPALRRFLELQARANAIIERASEILG